MKPLMLSFFAVILCYSLFFDRSEKQKHVDEVNYTIRSGAYDSFQVADTLPYYVYRLSPTSAQEWKMPDKYLFTVAGN